MFDYFWTFRLFWPSMKFFSFSLNYFSYCCYKGIIKWAVEFFRSIRFHLSSGKVKRVKQRCTFYTTSVTSLLPYALCVFICIESFLFVLCKNLTKLNQKLTVMNSTYYPPELLTQEGQFTVLWVKAPQQLSNNKLYSKRWIFI